jgi:DNA-binding SARP family transcriptional activator/tetratricopeptide (TPR) repeat protein
MTRSPVVDAGQALTARLIDGWALVYRGRELTGWPRPPARQLVTLLVLAADHRVSRAEVVRRLFPELPPERAGRAVSKAVSQARLVLGPDLLRADENSLWLAVPVHTDIADLLADIRAALRLTPGERRRCALTAALAGAGALLPEDGDAAWLAAPRRELAGTVRDARLALAGEQQEATGSMDGWRVAFEADRTDERAAIGLIRAYLARGERGPAVRTYGACRLALARQLGVGPSLELERCITPVLESGPPEAELVGRDAECAFVLEALRGAEVGDGRALLLTGPAGSGKTALLQAAGAELHRRGWLVAFAAAAAGDELLPYRALVSALTTLMFNAELHTPPSIRALLRPATSGMHWPLAVLTDDLARLLDRASAEVPVLLVLDDIHWSDPALSELIALLTSTGPGRSWSLLLAACSDEPNHPVPRLPTHVRILPLEPLRKPDAVLLARRTLAGAGTPPAELADLAERVAETSRGNPFFLLEVARQAAAGGPVPALDRPGSVPHRIVELLERRLAACSESARAALPVVAVAGRDASYRLLTGLLGRLSDVERIVDELVDAQLLTRSADGVRLIHPLLRHAAVARLNPLRLASLHEQVATALGGRGETDLQPVAAHRIAAFQTTRLAEYAPQAVAAGVAAGRAARAVLADDAAQALFSAALDAFEAVPASARQPLRAAACAGWLEMGDIHTDRLQLDRAEDAYRRSIGLADSDEERAAGYSALGGIAYKRGELAEAERRYRAGLELLRGTAGWARARLTADIAWVGYRQGREHHAAEQLRTAADEFTAVGDLVNAARSLDLLAVVLHGRQRLAEALAASDEALGLADRAGDPRLTPTLAAHRSGILLDCGRLHDAAAEAGRALTAARQMGDRYLQTVAHWSLADALDRLGDLTGALAARQAEAEVLHELDNSVNLAICLAHQATLLSRLGRPGDAEAAAGQARRLAEQTGNPQFRTNLEHRLAGTPG